MKYLVKCANTPYLLAGIIVGTVLACAAVYGIAEAKPLGESTWWAIVTACTVGYGDTYPTTLLGRFSATVLMISVIYIFLPLITANILNALIMDRNEFTHEEQEKIKHLLERLLDEVDEVEEISAGDKSGAQT